MPESFDASVPSEEAGPAGNPNFTGAFVGVCCQDLAPDASPPISTGSNTGTRLRTLNHAETSTDARYNPRSCMSYPHNVR